MNHWLDCSHILQDSSLGISDDLINFWDGLIKNKMAAAANLKIIRGVIIFSLFFLYIPGRSWTDLEISTLFSSVTCPCVDTANLRLWLG